MYNQFITFPSRKKMLLKLQQQIVFFYLFFFPTLSILKFTNANENLSIPKLLSAYKFFFCAKRQSYYKELCIKISNYKILTTGQKNNI